MPEATGQSLGEALLAGLRGERHTQGTQLLELAGMGPGVGRDVAGFGLDLVADPLNLVGVGELGNVARGVGRVAERVAPGLRRAGEFVDAAARSPELARAVPGNSVEAVGRGLPPRTADTMSDSIALGSPSGSMSKRATAAAQERVGKTLFGEGGLSAPTAVQPSEAEALRRQAANLRDLASRGMSPRAYNKRADALEAQAAQLEANLAKRGSKRYYHGTGSAFDKLEAGKFDPNGLYGPGYYLTDEPRVASSYAEQGAANIGSPSAPNVRAVDVPDEMRLLDVDNLTQQQAQAVIDTMPPLQQRRIYQGMRDSGGSSDFYSTLDTVLGGRAAANKALAQAGYDGIQHQGGQVTPIRDAAGNAVEHNVAVIFPESLPKLRNAISGTEGGRIPAGLALDVGSGTAGGAAGYATTPEGDTPEQRLQGAAMGAVAGVMGGRALQGGLKGRALRDVTPGNTIEEFQGLEPRYAAIEDRLAEIAAERERLLAERAGRVEAAGEIEMPNTRAYPWAAGMTKDELAQLARRTGRNPYAPDWYDAMDSVEVANFKSNRGGAKATSTQARDDPAARLRALDEESKGLKNESLVLQKNMERALNGETPLNVPTTIAEAEAQAGGSRIPPTQRLEPGVDMAPLPEKPGFAGNIRLEKYPEAIRPQIEAWAKAHPEEVQGARRGVRSDVTVQADAKALVEETGGDWNKLVKKWKPGQAWNADEVTALRGVLRTKTEDVLKAQQTARGNDSTENLLRLQYALTEQAAIQESLHGVTAEAGRALRAYRMPVEEALGSGDLPKMEKLLRYMGGLEQAKQMAGALAKIDVDDPRAVNAFIRATMKPGVQDYITELFYNSILSGPKTHIVNGVSNAVQALLDPVERSAAAGVDVVLANLPGRLGRGGQRQRYLGESARSLYGATMALPEAAKAFAYTLKNGFSPEAASKFEFRPRAFQGKLGRVINVPSNLLEASDQFLYIVNQRAAMHAQAFRMAKGNPEAVADLLANPTKELLEQADKMAEYRLFRNESDTANAITRFRDMTVPIGKDTVTGKPMLALQPMRFFVPFVRTPWNLLKYGMERSALGFLNPELYINLYRKDPAAADQIARAGLGTAMAAGVYLAVKDNITGAAPESAAERDRFYREGKQPYSIKVGDQWVPFSRLEPLNQTLNQLATLVNATKADDKTFDQKSLQFVADITKNLASQTFMTGVNDLINMVTEP
ncbi:MAG: hypothetical protein WC718_17325, partial [Phycisphaerales bacterium]